MLKNPRWLQIIRQLRLHKLLMLHYFELLETISSALLSRQNKQFLTLGRIFMRNEKVDSEYLGNLASPGHVLSVGYGEWRKSRIGISIDQIVFFIDLWYLQLSNWLT